MMLIGNNVPIVFVASRIEPFQVSFFKKAEDLYKIFLYEIQYAHLPKIFMFNLVI